MHINFHKHYAYNDAIKAIKSQPNIQGINYHHQVWNAIKHALMIFYQSRALIPMLEIMTCSWFQIQVSESIIVEFKVKAKGFTKVESVFIIGREAIT